MAAKDFCPTCTHPPGWHSEGVGCRVERCGCKDPGLPRRRMHFTVRLTAEEHAHLLECVDQHLSHDCDEVPDRAASLREVKDKLRKSRPR